MNDLIAMYGERALTMRFVEFVVTRVCQPCKLDADQNDEIEIHYGDTK